MTSPQMVTVEMGLLEEPAYECLSLLESQCEEKPTTCSASTTNSYECTILIEPFKASAFLAIVTGDAMVASAIDRHFDRQVITECLPTLRTFGIRDSLVPLRGKTSTREGFPLKLCHNKPRPGLSPHSQNNVAFTRFHVHEQRLIYICRNGLSHLHDCLNSRS